MERRLKTCSKNQLNRFLFATRKAVDSEKNLNLSNNEDNLKQNSLDYDSDKMNESEREDYDDLDENSKKSTKWTYGTVIN
jgi:hypothetical protein